jgi:hypothetical protein
LGVVLAKYADGVVVLAYTTGLVAVFLGRPALFAPLGGRESAFLGLTVGAFLLAGVHGAYAGAFVLLRPAVAVDHRVRPVTLRLGVGISDRLHRRMTSYDDHDGARRAGVYLLCWGVLAVALAAAGAALLL